MTLTGRLRDAALARAKRRGAAFDDFVLDETGVLDLRALDEAPPGERRASDPAALGEFAGKYGDTTTVIDLYAEENEKRRGRKLAATAAATDIDDDSELDSPVVTEGDVDAVDAAGADDADGEDADSDDSGVAAEAIVDPPITGTLRLSKVPLTIEIPSSVDVDLTTESDEPDLIDLSGDLLHDGPVDFGVDFGAPTVDASSTTWIEPISGDTPVETAPKAQPRFETEEDNPATAPCPRCTSIGARDLIDRFSQVDFWSCPHCFHMWQSTHVGPADAG